MREFFAFRIQDRIAEPTTILLPRKLFHQFLVDAYLIIKSQRLSYIRIYQKQLRQEVYKGLTEAILKGERNPSSKGRHVILPSSFIRDTQYMIQNYQDTIVICNWTGYPDLFITFTGNPKWPKIIRDTQQKGLGPQDWLDIICRFFKIKLDQMIKDFKHKKIFGRVKAGMYFFKIF